MGQITHTEDSITFCHFNISDIISLPLPAGIYENCSHTIQIMLAQIFLNDFIHATVICDRIDATAVRNRIGATAVRDYIDATVCECIDVIVRDRVFQ